MIIPIGYYNISQEVRVLYGYTCLQEPCEGPDYRFLELRYLADTRGMETVAKTDWLTWSPEEMEQYSFRSIVFLGTYRQVNGEFERHLRPIFYSDQYISYDDIVWLNERDNVRIGNLALNSRWDVHDYRIHFWR